jgi:hypothetical protein
MCTSEFVGSFCIIAKSDYYIRHVHPSIRPSGWNKSASPGRIFMTFDIVSIFRKSVQKAWLKYDKNKGTLREDLYTFIKICRWILLRVRNVSDRSCRENQSTRISCSLNFSRKSYRIWNDGKIWWSLRGRRWQYNTAHARCLLDNHGHILKICNTYCFSTGTVVKRKRLSVTLIRTLPALSWTQGLSNSGLYGVGIISWTSWMNCRMLRNTLIPVHWIDQQDSSFLYLRVQIQVFMDVAPCRRIVTDVSKHRRAFILRVHQSMKEWLEYTGLFVVYSHNFYSLSYSELVHDKLNTIKFRDVYLKHFFGIRNS